MKNFLLSDELFEKTSTPPSNAKNSVVQKNNDKEVIGQSTKIVSNEQKENDLVSKNTCDKYNSMSLEEKTGQSTSTEAFVTQPETEVTSTNVNGVLEIGKTDIENITPQNSLVIPLIPVLLDDTQDSKGAADIVDKGILQITPSSKSKRKNNRFT